MLRYWVKERRAIRERQAAGRPWPWSKDPIFQTYRFCNESRRFDKMTIALGRELAGQSINKALLIIIAYRLFNRTSTWEILRPYVVDTWDYRGMTRALNQAAPYQPLCAGTWMVSNRYSDQPPHLTHAAALRWAREHLASLRPTQDLKAQWHRFQTIPRVGPFVAHEMVNDLFYLTPHLGKVVDPDWVNFGPGSIRGMRRLCGAPPPIVKYEPVLDEADFECFRKLTRDPKLSHLTVHDLEHTLCEFDKYARVRVDGRPLKHLYRHKGA
jgi:hypothetical protein